jgi:UPF0755 protein
LRRRLAGFIVGLVVLAGAFGAWLRWELAAPYYGAGSAETFVDIPYGAGTAAIADALVAARMLHRRLPFMLYVRWTGVARRLQAGEYRFTTPTRPADIVKRMIRGDIYYRTITIPEGLTARETVSLIARNGLGDEKDLDQLLLKTEWIADLDPRAASLEGYLFPDTYRFSRRATSEEILKTLVQEFRTRISKLLAAAPLPREWSLPQIVTLASLIEKEVKTAGERRLVASVLVNRLRRKMPLGCDPTIIYVLKQAGTFDGNLRKSDLGIDTPYNTYLRQGLPPGPIANPGLDSLEAAVSPAASDFLYYVSRNDGTHVFSKDFRSHSNAVERYQKRGSRSKVRMP